VVEGFFYAQITSDETRDIDQVQNGIQVQGHTQPINMMVPEFKQSGHTVEKFRLPFTFVVKKQNRTFQVLTVKLKRSVKAIAISGFPLTVADLQRRSKMKWLQ
jgi:hypothetical protein